MVQFYTRSAINAEEIVLLGVKQTLIQDEDKMRDVKEKVLDELKELIILLINYICLFDYLFISS